tara:strand:- start:2247 stop:2447 length:201 start_codon:yes stop_codon:yes gene_type:complete
MNKLLNRIKSKKFWNECLETAKLFVIINYLDNLSRDGNYIGFWIVVFIFGFQPVYNLIQAKPWRKK